MAKKKNYTERFEMKLSEHELEVLKFAADYMGTSKSGVVRELIEQFYMNALREHMEE